MSQRATNVFIQVPVSMLEDVARAIEWASDSMARASVCEYEAGNSLDGDKWVKKSNSMSKIADRVRAKKAGRI